LPSGLVQPQRAVLDEPHHRQRGERLAAAGDRDPRVRGHRRPSARWGNPSARSTARRSPTSTVTTPVKSSSATAASSSCSAMCTGGRYAPPSPRGSEYASSGQPEPTGQVAGGDAARRRGHLGRGAGGDDASAGVATTGAQVDDPVRGGDGVQVVLDHDDGVPGVDEAVQLVEQEGDVGGVEPGGRLVEEVEG